MNLTSSTEYWFPETEDNKTQLIKLKGQRILLFSGRDPKPGTLSVLRRSNNEVCLMVFDVGSENPAANVVQSERLIVCYLTPDSLPLIRPSQLSGLAGNLELRLPAES